MSSQPHSLSNEEHERVMRYILEQQRREEARLQRRSLVVGLITTAAMFSVVLAAVRTLNPQAPWWAVLVQASITSAFVLATAYGELRHRRAVTASRRSTIDRNAEKR